MTANHRKPKVGLNRRAVLRAAGGIAIGLPFLEGLPERSAWAQGQEPVFGFLVVAACGVVGKNFFPNATGALTAEGLRSSGKSVAALADQAANLLFVKNVNFPTPGPTGCGHVQGLVQALTGRSPNGGDRNATSQGISADVQIAQLVNDGADPLTLYAGDKRNGYVVERISFKGAGSGQVRSADDNPYTLYNKLVTGGAIGMGGGGPSVTDELLASRKSVNDLVRAELQSLKNRPELSMEDKLRLDQHFQCIRDAENTMGGMAAACSTTGLSQAKIDALRTGYAFTTSSGMIEDVVKLHFELVALAFACNFNRVATLQWGDATDKTMYSVPSNNGLKWPFHYLSHRVQSDGATGTNPTAETAHTEIDALRMQTLAYGLSQFAARGLQNKAYVLWTNHVADGPSHSMRNVPHIIWGNAGGHFKQGQYVDAGNVNNNRLLTTLVSANVRDTGMAMENFAGASGQLAAIRA